MRLHDAGYRPNVGIALFDREGLVLVARRIGDDGPETVTPDFLWQMPQGGVDRGEEIEQAARRELAEETGIRTTLWLGRLDRDLTYDFPPYDGPPHRLSVFRGQRQTWVAMRFVGSEAEIDLAPTGVEPEFDSHDWVPLADVAGLVVPYKRVVYEAVAADFARFAVPGP